MTPFRRRSRSGVCSIVPSGRRFRQKEPACGKESKTDKGKGGGPHAAGDCIPDAAGIDIGAEEVFVAVPPDRAAEPVRSFETFTRDLHEMADWLQSCGVRTVAMESTGVSGFRCSRFSRRAASRCFSSMPSM